MSTSNLPRVPAYRRQSGVHHDRAFVEIDGARRYLGVFNSPESQRRYHTLIAEYLAAGGRLAVPPELVTLVELLNAFRKHAEKHYRDPAGNPGHEQANFRTLLAMLNDLYGDTLVKDFSPRQLKALRREMIERGWSRRHINRQVVRIRSIFRWGVSEGMVPPQVHQALISVDGLRAGRCDAKEHAPVGPVTQAQIDAVLPHLPGVVADMLQVQLLTAMRPGELCSMTAAQIDMSGETWVYRPAAHKTLYRGRERCVVIGPKAQAIIRLYLTNRPLHDHMFSPVTAQQQRRAKRHAARRTPMSCGNTPGSNRVRRRVRPERDNYTPTTYARALRYACETAWPHPQIAKIPKAKRTEQQRQELDAWNSEHRWTPNQLRHTAATRIRSAAGLEMARAALGHSTATVTEMFYAEIDVANVGELMKRLG